jgi:hypothetical protein
MATRRAPKGASLSDARSRVEMKTKTTAKKADPKKTASKRVDLEMATTPKAPEPTHKNLDIYGGGPPVRHADRYTDQGWPARVSGIAFTAKYNSSSAGPPPLNPYVVKPVPAFGFASSDPPGATRWRFESTR